MRRSAFSLLLLFSTGCWSASGGSADSGINGEFNAGEMVKEKMCKPMVGEDRCKVVGVTEFSHGKVSSGLPAALYTVKFTADRRLYGTGETTKECAYVFFAKDKEWKLLKDVLVSEHLIGTGACMAPQAFVTAVKESGYTGDLPKSFTAAEIEAEAMKDADPFPNGKFFSFTQGDTPLIVQMKDKQLRLLVGVMLISGKAEQKFKPKTDEVKTALIQELTRYSAAVLDDQQASLAMTRDILLKISKIAPVTMKEVLVYKAK